MDFFKYTQGGGKKRKADDAEESSRKEKKLKASSEDEDEESELESEPEPEGDKSATPKHRVKTTGSNVPTHLDTFGALRTRYNIPAHIYSNLEKYGYKEPTGIQAYGIPILMEVRSARFVWVGDYQTFVSPGTLQPYLQQVPEKPFPTYFLSWLL